MKFGLLFAQETASAEVAKQPLELIKACCESAITALQSIEGQLSLGIVLATIGIWLMMPGPRKSRRWLGGVVAFMGAACILSLAPFLGGTMQIPFSLLAGISLVAGVSTITSRNPVYAAIWFAVLLLGVGGLFLINGAQFVGIATVAVYAGAVVVTFLFVLMLAQPEGDAYYDRVGWGKISQLVGCLAGMLMTGAIVWAVLEPGAIAEAAPGGASVELAVDNPQHVASLGGQLFTRHLVTVQAAGALLLAALVGAVAMATHGVGSRGLDTRMSVGQESTAGVDA